MTLYAVTSGGGSSSGGGGSSSANKTSTTTNADGSVTKTETKPDGSSVTQRTLADGSTGTVKTDKNGQTTAETTLSSKAVEDAKKNGEAGEGPRGGRGFPQQQHRPHRQGGAAQEHGRDQGGNSRFQRESPARWQSSSTRTARRRSSRTPCPPRTASS